MVCKTMKCNGPTRWKAGFSELIFSTLRDSPGALPLLHNNKSAEIGDQATVKHTVSTMDSHVSI